MKKAFTFANMHIKNKQICYGFTLSEILITLGVIGVIAAITVPVLTIKIREQALINRYKVFYSDFNNVMNRYKYDNGYDLFSDSPIGSFSSLAEKKDYIINEIFDKYFGGEAKTYTMQAKFLSLTASTNITFDYITKKGVAIGIADSMFTSNLTIYFDINGTEPPNRIGLDIFKFYLYDTFIPMQAYKRKSDWDCQNCGDCCRPDLNNLASGYGCWARIIQDGWKIKYKY